MLKLACLTTLLLCGCSNVLPTTTTQLKSLPREANSLSESYLERSLNSKTLNVRCSMPAFCCVQYENVVIDGKEHKTVKGLCVGI
jgi:hypothetical protein